MQEAARGLASLGRHGDDTLLHVSRKELQGLQALTGKGFTRNPHTGLPEAFSWTSVLPIAAGIAATALTGGAAAPLAGALASGATSAGVGLAEGKSAQQALTQGLISGVTSYAGGDIMQGVGAGAGEAAGQAASQAAAPVVAPGVGGAVSAEPLAAIGAGSAGPATTIPAQAGAGLGSVPAAAAPAAPAPGFMEGLGQNISSYGDRISNIASDPGKAFQQLGANVREKPYSALMAVGGTYAQAMDALTPKPYQYKDTYDPSKYPEQFPSPPRSWNAPPASYQPGVSPEYRYFAKGGLAEMKSDDHGMTSNVVNEAKAALLGEHPRAKDALDRFRGMFGDDALAILRDRVSGGRVRGAGGGMDDLIPGTIEGRQQVRLADGEFVVPADVVSGLGDGSTDQGVRRLKEMMNKVRSERTGRTVQPKAVGGKITL